MMSTGTLVGESRFSEILVLPSVSVRRIIMMHKKKTSAYSTESVKFLMEH